MEASEFDYDAQGFRIAHQQVNGWMVREMSGEALEAAQEDGISNVERAHRIAQACAFTEDGTPVFSDVAEARRAPWRLIQRIADLAADLSDLGASVEDRVGN